MLLRKRRIIMLVLTRKPNQRFMIGDNIIIQILKAKGSQVTIGITAPKDVVIHREEIYIKAKKEKKQDD